MNKLILIILFVFWYLGALVISENTPKENKLGREWMFFISMILSPVVGLAAKLLFTNKQ